MKSLTQKKKMLETALAKYKTLAVAFSGGVDSTFLLASAKKVLKEKGGLIAITAVSPIHPEKELTIVRRFVKENHIKHLLIYSDELDSDEFTANPSNRCYICKHLIFRQIIEEARKYGVETVAHGVNVDDQKDFRPGLKAATELNIRAPLLDAGMTKDDIRQLSKEMGLSVWNKPSSGCLATRIPYGEAINLKKLKMIEKAEDFLFEMGFDNCRVRYHNELAKIEVPSDLIAQFLNSSVRKDVVKKFQEIGFIYIALDLEGYSSGSLNRAILSEPDLT